MILTFHVPPKVGGKDYVISIVYSTENNKKIWKSWHGGIFPIFSNSFYCFDIFLNFYGL